jgi:hypothetical protein
MLFTDWGVSLLLTISSLVQVTILPQNFHMKHTFEFTKKFQTKHYATTFAKPLLAEGFLIHIPIFDCRHSSF